MIPCFWLSQAMEQAQSALALQEVSMKSADAKLAAGTITKNTYESQKVLYHRPGDSPDPEVVPVTGHE